MESQGETLVGVVARLQQQLHQRAKALELQSIRDLADQLNVDLSPALAGYRRVGGLPSFLDWPSGQPASDDGSFVDMAWASRCAWCRDW